MIDFPNLRNISSVDRVGAGRQFRAVKNEGDPVAAAKTGATDIVQISTDAAMKSKISAFASTLAKEMDAVSDARIARLKEQYAGDQCPVSSGDIAEAIIARIKTEGPDYE